MYHLYTALCLQRKSQTMGISLPWPPPASWLQKGDEVDSRVRSPSTRGHIVHLRGAFLNPILYVLPLSWADFTLWVLLYGFITNVPNTKKGRTQQKPVVPSGWLFIYILRVHSHITKPALS